MGLKIFIGAAVLTLIFNLLLFKTDWQMGWGILFLSLNLYFFFTRTRESNTKLGLVVGGLASLFGFLNGVYDNDFVQFLNVLMAFVLTVSSLYLFRLGSPFSYQIRNLVLAPFRVGISAIRNCVEYLGSSPWSAADRPKHAQNAAIRGLIIAVPIAVILMVLFTHADPIFGKYIQGLTKNISSRVIVSGIVFAVVFVAAFAKFEQEIELKFKKVTDGKAFELGTIIGIVSAVLLAFIFFQFRYLFGTVDERQIHTLGISVQTYSEYLRRGFVELTIATAITSAVLFYVTQYIHDLKDKQKRVVQGLSLLLTAGIIMIMISAGKRLDLQIDTHGLTDIRIYGMFFLAELILVLGVFLLSIFKPLGSKTFFAPIAIGTICILLGLNMANVDRLSITKKPPTINNHIDYRYLADRSSDGYEGRIQALDFTEREMADLRKKSDYDDLDYSRLIDVEMILYDTIREYGILEAKYGDKAAADKIGQPYGYPTLGKPATIASYNLSEKRAYDNALKGKDQYKRVINLHRSVVDLRAYMDTVERTNKASESAKITPAQ